VPHLAVLEGFRQFGAMGDLGLRVSANLDLD
jgi:hypothetical protein